MSPTVTIAEGGAYVGDEVGELFESRQVREPEALDVGVAEHFLLTPKRFLLAIGAVERIDVGEELLRIRLLRLPWRVSQDGVEAAPRRCEDIRVLKLPVEESDLPAEPLNHPCSVGGASMEGARGGHGGDGVGGPEPESAPLVEERSGPENARIVGDPITPEALPFVGGVEWQPLNGSDGSLGRVMGRRGYLRHRVSQDELAADLLCELGSDDGSAALCQRPSPRRSGVMNSGVILVAAPTPPSEQRIVGHAINPAAHQRVADLKPMVEELEGQLPVHGLDPERQPGQLHSEWVDVDAVDAVLHDVALQSRAEPRLEVAGIGEDRDLLGELRQSAGLGLGEANDRARSTLHNPSVTVEAGEKRIGQKAQTRH